ncbi:siroheme synthase CysG [Thalassovita taeanensis]|uniref:Uroporphyrin-III C-methyltransferase / precorrin-2 dehydrogenase / sirohydrochlorin ferrochelatase n=1 Tax=Thalassovita taeanensis TaxID=657014 RepID=A0A1H8YRZ1_9RHOB|nr:siroheme synthase CysG [Thalassovita taeanensis]SEP54853.1 uroporphyrin-III C-methyltransferase / precorrin-2 dehydrogenase / sirohydrochlorin ferrochelatase [Thalassovita taeanensis]
MKSFPMFLRMADRRVVIAGGGEQAAQKARLVLKTEAALTFLAPTLDDELAAIVASGRANHDAGPITLDSFANTALVFIGTGCPGNDAALHALAKQAGATVNVVDQPDLCDATTPSIVDRDPVVVAIGTEGTAPVLARRLKTDIEQMLDPRLGSFAALAGRLRSAVAAHVPRDQRRAFWRWTFNGTPWQSHKRGAEREAADLLKTAIAGHGAPGTPAQGQITLVGAGPGARDLLTLRAVERLQEADVIFYDRLVDPDVLELARRDAERVFVGKTLGTTQWPQDRINEVILSAARQGRRVVRLKSGDPSIFGRATEELETARAANIPVEIVPGVTAASAAAAALGRPLTERGQTDRVTFATGTCRPGDDTPDWADMALPGTTLVLYMAVTKAAEVQDNLRASGLPATTEVEIVGSATHAHQKIARCTLDALAATIQAEAITNPAVLLIRHPKAQPATKISLAT